ncbi:hypothetical protein AKJ09_00623 [Labilithrix luteola]|uniref:Outer membrane lipoprotein BamD-like domain-containing protein n=1 Tax=Labilithrix luteola TaxID=1391654 RepID=A0A0K1PLG4_9BACT|nr:hypothetical protein [Labilithrix luteola]AKU93959.1 hypothetical protein AKJ09_00623 [Labilithrix luteola]
MNFDTDPPRLSEGEGESAELARLVRASRARRPTTKTTAGMAERLAATSVYASAARGITASRGTTFAKVGLVALVGIGLGVFTARTHGVETPPSSSVVENRVPSVAPSAEPPAPPTTEMPSIPVDALPSSAPVAATVHAETARAAQPASPSPEATRVTSTRESEFTLVRHAQDALAVNPGGALSLAQEHARTFPNGELVQEREVIAVEALSKLGRSADAKARATALVTAHPRSPYVARLERAIGEPLAPPSSADSR